MNELNLSILNLTALAVFALAALTPGSVHADGGAVDTMNLTDEPGNGSEARPQGHLLLLSEPVSG
jgi:hypothetical protein